MKKVAFLIILIMASGLSMYGQNSYKVTSLVKLSDIKEKNCFNGRSLVSFVKISIEWRIAYSIRCTLSYCSRMFKIITRDTVVVLVNKE